MFLVDSHCHFDLLSADENDNHIAEVIKRAQANHVHYFLNVSVSLQSFPAVIKTAEAFPMVSASVGVHPNEQNESLDMNTLISLAHHPKVIAIGETGLDYFRSTGDLSWQQDRFRIHIEASKALNKPLIVHTRNASEDTIAILTEEKASEAGGVMHCFTENWDVAKKALDLGFYISFSGIVTFKDAQQIQAVAKKLPLDRMLLETDAPYLAPNPHRGKVNEPAFVSHTAQFIADLREIPIETLAEKTTLNFFQLFSGAIKPHV